ncbi:MAG: NUDIX hydrolase [Candidatus Anstonellales archaeon]
MTNPQNTIFEFSAGGIVVDKERKVLVIKTKNLKGETVFTFPKGHIEKEETSQQAAVREVQEETGVLAKIIKKIKDVKYWFFKDNKKILKNVCWYLMVPLDIRPGISKEVEEVLWYPIEDVSKILSYNSDKELINEIMKEISLKGE